MTIRGAVSLKLQGYTPANQDAVVTLFNPATQQRIQRKPFRDGSLVVRDIDPGQWEVEVAHPNLIAPIFQQRVRIIPQVLPTLVPVPIRPDLFRDSPIRDVPDVDLGPIQQAVASTRERVAPIAGKAPGEVIRADDWNQMASAVADLAGAVLELTRAVSPRGHDHPEIAEKIDEVQGNIRRFTTSFGQSLLELRRDIENQNLHKATVDMLDIAGVVGADRERIIERVDGLQASLHESSVEFTTKMAATGTVLAAEVNRIAQSRGAEAGEFLAQAPVQNVLKLAQTLSISGGTIKAEQELETYRRTGVATGSKLTFAGRPG